MLDINQERLEEEDPAVPTEGPVLVGGGDEPPVLVGGGDEPPVLVEGPVPAEGPVLVGGGDEPPVLVGGPVPAEGPVLVGGGDEPPVLVGGGDEPPVLVGGILQAGYVSRQSWLLNLLSPLCFAVAYLTRFLSDDELNSVPLPFWDGRIIKLLDRVLIIWSYNFMRSRILEKPLRVAGRFQPKTT